MVDAVVVADFDHARAEKAVAAVLPDPAGPGELMTGKDGEPQEVYLYHVVDNAWSMSEYGTQAVVWQRTGVLGPEAINAVLFLDLLTAYGSPWGLREGG